MSVVLTVTVVVLAVLGLALSVRVVQQYEQGVLFRLGRVIGVREPGLRLIVPVIEVLRRVSLRIVTMPIQSQGIITRAGTPAAATGRAARRYPTPPRAGYPTPPRAARPQPGAGTTTSRLTVRRRPRRAKLPVPPRTEDGA